jgi:hypothetical protein
MPRPKSSLRSSGASNRVFVEKRMNTQNDPPSDDLERNVEGAYALWLLHGYDPEQARFAAWVLGGHRADEGFGQTITI